MRPGELENLVKMALEAEALEAESHDAQAQPPCSPFVWPAQLHDAADTSCPPALRLAGSTPEEHSDHLVAAGASRARPMAGIGWWWALPVAACIGLAAIGTRLVSQLLVPAPGEHGIVALEGLKPQDSQPPALAADTRPPVVHTAVGDHAPFAMPVVREASLVMAVSLDESTNCRCTQTVIHQWSDDRSLQSVGRDEVLRVGLESSCLPSPDRMLVLVVSGPIDQLPRTPEAQLQLASCIDLTDEDDPYIDDLDLDDFSHDEGKYAAYAQICLGNGVSIEAVTLRMGR
ncbi:MAG: hypothetical protein KF859_01905 [Phycisphaeraceae bacterium]|nr:hypothetical protein [Phycisphaeraceae bacterium]